MGLNVLFSSDATNWSNDDTCGDNVYSKKKYTIQYVLTVGNHVVAMVNYVNATNYGGDKLMVFRDTSAEAIREATILDPHFDATPGALTPFARFEPTDEGKSMAIHTCTMLNKAATWKTGMKDQ